MIGMILWHEPEKGNKQKAVVLREKIILHMRFLCAEVKRGKGTPEPVLRRRVLAAAKQLRKQGIIRVVPPEDFDYGQQLEKTGVRLVSTLALRRALAAEWVRFVLEKQEKGNPSGAKVAVFAAQLTGEAVRAVTELSLRHRYVLLELPVGGEELCRQLRREYGVSLLLNPTEDQMAEADVLVLFDARPAMRQGNAVVLPLYTEDAELPHLLLPPALEAALPEGADRERLLAAIQDAGVLKNGQISLGEGKNRP